MAHLSEDPALLKAFHEGDDIHRVTAAEIFGVPIADVTADQRRYIKAVNFGLIYGMSAFGLAAAAQHRAQRRRSNSSSAISRAIRASPRTCSARASWRASRATSRRCSAAGCSCRTSAPRADRGAQAAERAAINAPMQGTAADLIKLAMIAVQDYLDRERLATRLILQVHDELVLEAPGWRGYAHHSRPAGADDVGRDAARAAEGRRRPRAELGAGALEPISKLAARPDSFVVSSLAPRCTSMYYLGARCGPSRSRAARRDFEIGSSPTVTASCATAGSAGAKPQPRLPARSFDSAARSPRRRRQQRAAPALAADGRRHRRLHETAVRFVDEEPRAPIRHPERPGGRTDRAGACDGFEQRDLSRTDRGVGGAVVIADMKMDVGRQGTSRSATRTRRCADRRKPP